MKYLYKLSEYAEHTHGNCNRKVIREFLAFLEDKDYTLEQSDEALSLFAETDWFSERSKYTKRNYMRDLKRFIEYVYDSEGEPLYPAFVEQPHVWRGVEKLEDIRRQLQKEEEQETGAEEEEELDEEYKQFLNKYEKIAGD